MRAPVTEESGAGRSFEGDFSSQRQQQERCQSREALAEWRSSDQIGNGIPSTSPPYWNSDDGDEEVAGLKLSDLYGKYTWKIKKFSQIKKRELRSDAFEVGGYKWYILIYPQGCDVCNHLSLFLCVADHDKLLPGWSHFAQFTIAVVNKDPRKSKYSDTLHRFWRKEHDWGWKKFMELSKVLDEFIEVDTLIIEAQVQVIRERAERPFHYLEYQYRRELVRVYLTNVEKICRRFLEERRGKLGKLIGDKARWSSLCTFWLGMDQTCRRRMSREKTETILKVVVKNFFIEKEVTSTLVMESLYSGLKALEVQYKWKKSNGSYVEVDKLPIPIVRVEKEMFVLVDDVLPLLERAAEEPVPPKDERGPQNRITDETLGEEFNKNSIECDERRLTELGRRTIEIFVLSHVFNKIEVAYQEAVSLKKQEELIREEEAAWLADIEHRAKRGVVDKEKKSKKKQAKQKRNNRKSKDKGKDDNIIAQDKIEQDIHTVKKKESLPTASLVLLEKSDDVEYVSDTSDSVECVPEILTPDSEDQDASPVNWDIDSSEMHPPTEASSIGVSGLSSVQNGTQGISSSVVDDSSSTFSSDSVHSIAISVTHRGSYHYQKNRKSPSRGKNPPSKLTSGRAGWVKEEAVQLSKAVPGTVYQVNGSRSSKAVEPLPQMAHHSFLDRVVTGAERQIAKEEDADYSRKCGAKSVDVEVSGEREASLLSSPSKSTSVAPWKFKLKVNAADEKSSSDRISRAMHEPNAATLISDMEKFATPKFTENPTTHQVQEIENPSVQPVLVRTDKPSMTSTPVISRPLTAPLIPASVPTVSVVPITPILAHSVGAAPSTQSHPPHSYLSAIVGGATAGSLPAFTRNNSASSMVDTPVSYSQAPAFVPVPSSIPQTSDWMDPSHIKPSFSFGMMNHSERLQNAPLWLDSESSRNLPGCGSLLNGMQSSEFYSSERVRPQDHLQACSSDEFPHLDIINYLLEDEQGVENIVISDSGIRTFSNGLHYLNRHFSFPGDPDMPSALPASSCRFERTRSYQDDAFQRSYGASGASHDAFSNISSLPFLNGQIAGLTPYQWQMASADLPLQSVRASENDISPYRMMEYQYRTVDVNGYTVFRPANGF